MGGGIAMNFANAGIPVTLLEVKQEALDRGLKTIRTNYENTAKRGGMKAEDVEKRMALITPTLSYDGLKDADVIIEAVFETMEVKEGVFKQLDAVAKPGAILATNTSGLDVNQIATYTKRPGDVIGMHFFSPANVMKLLGERARQGDRRRTSSPRSCRSARRSARSRSWSASARASSATACCASAASSRPT